MIVGTGYQNYGAPRPPVPAAAAMQASAAAARPIGESLIGKLDTDGDGKLGQQELSGDSDVQRWLNRGLATDDSNGDGMLDAAEITYKHDHRNDAAKPVNAAAAESVVAAQMADYLAAQVEPEVPAGDVVTELMARLDADGNGGLNSEEIAGTRLAERIGAGFYDLDGDRSGTLTQAELGGFVRNIVLSLADEIAPAPADDVAAADAAEPVAAADDAGAVETVETADAAEASAQAAAAEAAEEASAEAQAYESIQNSFETALALIQSGQDTRSSFDVVSALYGDIQAIFEASDTV